MMYAFAQHLERGKAETAAGELADALVKVSEEHGHEGFIVAGGFSSLRFGWSNLTAKMGSGGWAMRLTRSRA